MFEDELDLKCNLRFVRNEHDEHEFERMLHTIYIQIK